MNNECFCFTQDEYSPSKKRSRPQDTLSDITYADTSIVKAEKDEAEVEKKPRLEKLQTSVSLSLLLDNINRINIVLVI